MPPLSRHAIILRTASAEDVDAITTLFANTIRTINARDYSPDEVRAWSAGAEQRDKWLEKMSEQTFYMAYRDDVFAGFGSIRPDGYLDFLFVHQNHQRVGVAAALLSKIENKAQQQGNAEIWAYASKTAFGFFTRHGFLHAGDKETVLDGVRFVSAKVVKVLA